MIEFLAARIAAIRVEIAEEESFGGGDPERLAGLHGALGEAEAIREAVLNGDV